MHPLILVVLASAVSLLAAGCASREHEYITAAETALAAEAEREERESYRGGVYREPSVDGETTAEDAAEMDDSGRLDTTTTTGESRLLR